MAGLTFLTDPIFSERASPFQFLGPRQVQSSPDAKMRSTPVGTISMQISAHHLPAACKARWVADARLTLAMKPWMP